TLYVGTTMAAHVRMRADGRVKLEPQEGAQLAAKGPLRVPFHPTWGEWRRIDAVERDWPEILEHLSEVIAVTPQGRLKEGKIQAALERVADGFAIVDREVVLSHESELHRSSVRAGLSGWVATVLEAGGGALPPSRPKSFGNKLDA